MARWKWVVALSSVCTGALIAAACSDSTSSDTPAADGADAATEASNPRPPPPPPPPPPPTNDAGDAGDAATPDVPPTIAFLNASPNLGTLRTCTKLAGFFAPAYPQDAIPQMFGGGIPLTDNEALAFTQFSVQNTYIKASAIPTAADGGLPTCSQILGGLVGVPPEAMFTMEVIPKGSVKAGKAYMLGVLGCVPGSDEAPAICGAGYDGGTSTLHEVLFEVDGNTAVPAGNIGAQGMLLSPYIEQAFPSGVKIGLGITDAGADAGPETYTWTQIGQSYHYSEDPAAAAQAKTAVVVPVNVNDLAAAKVGIFANVDGGVPNAPLPLQMSLQVVSLVSTQPGYSPHFRDKKTYVFIPIGDLAGTPPQNPFGVRVLAIPTQGP